MDYSGFHLIILSRYIFSFLGLIFISIFLIWGTIYLIKRFIKNKIKYMLIGASVIILSLTLIYLSLDFYKDIPNAINSNYEIVTGVVVVGNNGGRAAEVRDFKIKKENGEIVTVVALSEPLFGGETMEVILLPNTGYGVIIRIIESDTNTGK